MPRPGGWCHQPPMPGLRQEMESHAAPQFRHSGGHAWGATLPAPAAPPSPMSGRTFMGGAAGPGHAVPSPMQYSAGAEILLPAYMTGATKDPPRASREELSSALAYASQAGIRYSGGYFTYTGSNRRWYVTQNSGTVIDASVSPGRQCGKCKSRHWVFDPCPALGAGPAAAPPPVQAPT
eukprot:gene20008-biopygen20568